MDNLCNVLANNMLRFRKRTGLTQEGLAEKLGVTFQSVSKWENAKCAPDTLMLPKIADIFECSIDDLFSRMPYEGKKEIRSMLSDIGSASAMDIAMPEMKRMYGDNSATEKLRNTLFDNSNGHFELTDENIERLLDAYRELFKLAK